MAGLSDTKKIHNGFEGKNQKETERFINIIYSIYILVILYVSVRQDWSKWIICVLIGCLGINWIVYAADFKTYRFRAVFSAILMQVSVVLYALRLEDFSHALPVFITFIAFLGMYGMEKLIYIAVLTSAFIFFYHGFIQNDFMFQDMNQTTSVLSQFANMLLLEYVIYVWTKRNREGSRQLLGVIQEMKTIEKFKDDFVANVSHEIRTPINTICGMSEIVLREKLPYHIKENVLNIQTAGQNLKFMVSDILDFSELQSGKMELEEEKYNITSSINDVINMTMAKINEKKIELIIDCDANIPNMLLGDEKKLRRIILNLVDNAIKFTEEGCVTIAIGYQKEDSGFALTVTVKDTGIGMDEPSLEKLFTSYSQVDTGSKRQEGGIGLGLAISRILVQKMGGTITVESEKGIGTAVTVTVPQKIVEESPIASIQNRERLNVAIYIDMNQFDVTAVREAYAGIVAHMVDQLQVKCHICHKLSELKNCECEERLTHIFISVEEYHEAREYFDELSDKIKVIVLLDRFQEKEVTNSKLLRIFKPFHSLTIASAVNGQCDCRGTGYVDRVEKFVTRNAHVLVVDDNAMNLKVIQGLLANYKIQITTAVSGKEALEKITTENYDFVFMDHMMPEMDGVEAMQRIRQKDGEYYRRVPIVALTANAVAGARETLMAQGFSDFLEKPVERSALERVLRRNLAPEKIVSVDAGNDSPMPQETASTAGEAGTAVQGLASTAGLDSSAEEVRKDVQGLEQLVDLGLDVEKGILYCNGRETYLQVLRGCCEEYRASAQYADLTYEKGDWKNYTIAVHGMKGAMNGIGAMRLAEMAKQLELAGKESRIEYIRENHAELMREYTSFFAQLCCAEILNLPKNVDEKTKKEVPILEDSVFEQILEQMEEAMYDLDGETLMELLTRLQDYEYGGVNLMEEVNRAKKKVEKSDYFSAVEQLKRLKEKYSKEN